MSAIPTPQEALAAWQAGESMLGLARRMGLKRRQLRKAWAALGVDRAAQDKMRAAGAGGHRVGVARAPGASAPVYEPPNDAKVPVLASHVGWTTERLPGTGDTVFVAPGPDALRYVTATSRERADLLYVPRTKGLSPLRLRLLTASATGKAAKGQAAAHDRHRASRAAKRADKAAHRAQVAAVLAPEAPVAATPQPRRKVRRKGPRT